MWQFDRFADKIALLPEDGGEISYAELRREGERLATAVGGRRLVFALCSNTGGSLLGYTAFLNHRITPLLLKAETEDETLAALLEIYKPDFLWLPAARAAAFAQAPLYSAWGYSLLKTPHSRVFPLHGELALLLTTSGSTGSPKFVRQSYENIRANTESITQYLELSVSERPITTLPMSYTYGLSVVNSHLWAGASIILTDKALTQKEFWQQFKQHGATSLSGVPYTYEMLDRLRFCRMEPPSLRTLTQAGGKLPLRLQEKFAAYAERTGRRFIVMYGQTEATARMSYLPPEKALAKSGSVGVAIPGGEFSLLDAAGGEITAAGVVGELVYKGANVTMGYAESGADLAKGDERGGVLLTGDMARRDGDGYYYIVGRKKRFLKIFGNRVNLDEAEQLVRAEFDCDCACAGVDDKMTVYVTDAAIAPAARKFIAAKTQLPPSAFDVRPVAAIPKNEAGKTQYSALED
ncbi:MAG: AMP-binding protein [Gracilibacteraceae bacterium]|jgi:acyl-CoA synthetase (AMP-forming)/AMP-acid ligase II|nr:AMP-binding protein [Gracilibacteraceae bacterium]